MEGDGRGDRQTVRRWQLLILTTAVHWQKLGKCSQDKNGSAGLFVPSRSKLFSIELLADLLAENFKKEKRREGVS